ncbi:MAG: geranylgeranyl reductase family protein [Candidatus Thorarchaeota archaeon]
MYDLAVIGGGPAGATCARRAAEAGLDVVLLEKTHHPREKPCGGALGPQTIQNIDLDISSVIERSFNAAIVHTPSGKKVTLTSEDLLGHIVSRSEFDAYLLQKATESGVDVVQGVEVVGLEQLRSGIRALAVGDSYKSHLLVGADGVNGIVARELGVRTKWSPKQVGLCILANVPMSSSDVESVMMTHGPDESAAIELYFGLVSWGYGWCFPKRNGFNIGIGCRVDKLRNLQQTWEAFVAIVEREKGIELDVSNRGSYRVPLGGKLDRCISRRSMLIGDAAGLVSPFTGEGISYAIQSGAMAAKIASEAVESKSPLHIVEYENQLKKTIGQELMDTRWLAGLLHKSHKHTDLLFQIAEEDPVMQMYLTDIVSRVTTFSDVRIKVVTRLLTKHPLKAIRLGLKG